MSKVAVVYWSGTGNTEAMAEAVVEGARAAGADVSVFGSGSYDRLDVTGFDGLAFGCPAMGAEVLEEDEFGPMFDKVKSLLAGKKLALFGSYGWGDGEWMRNWEEDVRANGGELSAEALIVNDAPDEEALESCKALGAAVV